MMLFLCIISFAPWDRLHSDVNKPSRFPSWASDFTGGTVMRLVLDAPNILNQTTAVGFGLPVSFNICCFAPKLLLINRSKT